MIGKLIIKTVKGKIGRLDKETEAIKQQVLELDSKKNCIYFDRFTHVIRGAK